ncbi:MAG: V-type ATP synthase subunit E [Waddliaceae bacterium]
MKTLEKSENKVQQICEQIRNETIEPAEREAKAIVQSAQEEAKAIVSQAEQHVEKMFVEAKRKIEQERNVFTSSLQQGAKQVLDRLRQSIETKLFNPELNRLVSEPMNDPKLISKVILAITDSIKQEGISSDFSVVVSNAINKEELAELIGKSALDRLRDKQLTVDAIGGGVKVKLHDKKVTLDFSEEALKELLSRYIRKDFRELIF